MGKRLVVVRDFRGKPSVARLWRDRGEFVDVVAKDWEPGDACDGVAIPPIGFPRSDVFDFDEDLLRSEDWSTARAL